MFKRSLLKTVLRFAKFPVVAILGPRQSGKTTLAKLAFPHYRFLSFDNDVDRAFAQEDPE